MYKENASFVRGFSEGKSETSKRATNIGLAKTNNFFIYGFGNSNYYFN